MSKDWHAIWLRIRPVYEHWGPAITAHIYRLSPQGIRRVGSLGIDQFASVAFSVSAIIWLGLLWQRHEARIQQLLQRYLPAAWRELLTQRR